MIKCIIKKACSIRNNCYRNRHLIYPTLIAPLSSAYLDWPSSTNLENVLKRKFYTRSRTEFKVTRESLYLSAKIINRISTARIDNNESPKNEKKTAAVLQEHYCPVPCRAFMPSGKEGNYPHIFRRPLKNGVARGELIKKMFR